MGKKKYRKNRGKSAAEFFGGRRADESINYTDSRQKQSEKNYESKKKEYTTNATEEELLEELGVVNLSIEIVNIIILATFLNLYYTHSLKAQILDALYDTNLSDNFVDTSNFPKITNTVFLFTTGTFLLLNYYLLQESSMKHQNKDDNEDFSGSYKAFLASLFTFLAVVISRDNLDI